jgi:hypothetical protein
MNFFECPFLKKDATYCPVTPGIESLLDRTTVLSGNRKEFEVEIYKTG